MVSRLFFGGEGMTEPVFCQNCGRHCNRVYEGRNGLPYCSRDCEITDRLIVEYEWAIVLTIFMLCIAMTLTADYMETKYSPITQEQEK